MTIKTIFFVIFVLMSSTFSQEPAKAPVDSVLAVKKDSVNTISTAANSLSALKNTVAADSINTEKPAAKLNKRNYNHREQIIFGSAMMAFFAIILTTVQSMNPN